MRRLTDEDRENLEIGKEVVALFREEHGRNPTLAEFKAEWKAYCEADLRRVIELVERQGTRVVYEEGKYKLLARGTNLAN